ncbi:unnamed protein product [Rhizophagus irregularis]|nr:unnamed protein product [Rhizophagus irregularis]
MFTCPFQQCQRTFSRRPALHEHTKTHQGQAYWEILNRITENSHNIVEDIRVDYSDENITFEIEDEHEDNFTVNEIYAIDEHDVDEYDVDEPNTTQEREFVNSINIEHLLYLKTKILEYENEVYYLHHRPIFDAVKELLSNADILKYCQWDFLPEYIVNNDDGHHERVYYGEQWSGMWWERIQNLLGTNNKKSFASAKRILYQHCFDIMTKPIYEKLESGLDIVTDNQIIWAFPFLSEFIGDLPEDAALTLTYNSSICKRPCHICTIIIDELNKPDLSHSQIEL